MLNFVFYIAKASFSSGVGKAYIYDSNSSEGFYEYEDYSDIKNRLKQAQRNLPYYYIYINNTCFDVSPHELSRLRKLVGREIANEIRKSILKVVDI